MITMAIGMLVRQSGLTPDNPNYDLVYEVRGFVDNEVVWRLRSHKVGHRYSTNTRAWVEQHWEVVDESRRARVQGDHRLGKGKPGREPGTIAWWEHEMAWADYARRYGSSQSAEPIHERGGFGYRDLEDHLKREPFTWRKEP